MKRHFFTFAAACLLAITGLTAQTPNLVIKHGKISPEIDGNPNDVVWSQIDPVAIEKNFQTEEPSVTAFFKMYYTDEYLYLLVDVTDDKHYPVWMTDDVKNNWQYDKLEIYFDVNDNLKDGQGPAHNGANVPPIAPGHAQLAPAFDETMYGGGVTLPSDQVYGCLDGQVYVAYNYKENDKNSYVVEYEFPLAAFINDRNEALSMAAFKALPQGMGFDITVVDNDNDGKGRKRKVWMSNENEAYVNMDGCGVVKFSDEELPAESGLRQLEWKDLSFFPNPVQETLTVNGDFDQVVMLDLTGQLVKTAEGNSIQVADLINGLYIVKAYKNGVCQGVGKVTKE